MKKGNFTTLPPGEYLNAIKLTLEPQRNASNAQAMEAYMKHVATFLGIKSAERRNLQRQFLAANGRPRESELDPIVRALWQQPEREYQYFAQELTGAEKLPPPSRIGLYEYLITTKSWWDTVDYLATTPLGNYFRKYPEKLVSTTQGWVESGNMWLQRSALLCQLKYGNGINEDLLFGHIRSLQPIKEFFIQKAIGWSLRQYARIAPDRVMIFVEESGLQGLAKREALKHL